MENPNEKLIEAIEKEDIPLLKSALSVGADVNYEYDDDSHSTALHLASSLARPSCLIELLNHSQNLEFRSNVYGETPLHTAALHSSSSVSVLLLASAFGISLTKDNEGNTFFHTLMVNRGIPEDDYVEMLLWLLDNGCIDAINEINFDCNTPLDIARNARKSFRIISLLTDRGAISAKHIWINQISILEYNEIKEREKIIQHEERFRDRYKKAFDSVSVFFAKLEQKIGKLILKEEERRLKVIEGEEKKRASSLRKYDERRNKIIRDEDLKKLRIKSCLIIQRIGRGYLTRSDSRRLQAVVLIQQTARGFSARKNLADLYRVHKFSLTTLDNSDSLRVNPFKTFNDQNTFIGNKALGSLFGTEEENNANELHEVFRKVAALRIFFFYKRNKQRKLKRLAKKQKKQLKKMQNAAILIQAYWRGWAQRVTYLTIYNACAIIKMNLKHFIDRKKRCNPAADILMSELKRFCFLKRRRLFLLNGIDDIQRSRIEGITRSLTQLVWRENFCSEMKRAAFLNKRKRELPPPTLSKYKKMKAMTLKYEKYTMGLQILISLFLLIYQGCVPRTKTSSKHNNVDIAFTCVQFVLTCLIPLQIWTVLDFIIIIVALVCQASKTYGGGILISFLIFKIPLLLKLCFPKHSGTRTYCRAIKNSAFYLCMFSPIGLAGVGATVRGTQRNSLLASSEGNWGRVFLLLFSTMSPQYSEFRFVNSSLPSSDSKSLMNLIRTQRSSTYIPSLGSELVYERTPIVQLLIMNAILLLYSWSAIILGTHTAIRSHYDISDETKLKVNKHRFHNNEENLELLDAHRAASMKALGQKLDGVMWEADVRAAKEAVDASHYDHTTGQYVHRFVRRVQDSVVQSGGMGEIFPKFKPNHVMNAEERKWDCRNEDPRSRGTYDIEVIEAALGIVEHKGFFERFFQRQWTGQIFERETTVVLLAFLIMASIKPNLFAMEAIFSAFFVVELLLSFYFLKFDFILSHYIRLLIRIFCALVGFIPSAVPFVGFRFLRFFEGWSTIFMVPGMVRFGFLYAVLSFVCIWMIAFVAAIQFSAEKGLEEDIICRGVSQCLAISLRELVLPAWTPMHIDPTREAPIMALLVLVFHLFFIPLTLTIVLHPLLQLSNFIGRFLRIVVQSLHKDVLKYIESYLEGEDWYRRWELKSNVSVRVMSRLKLWVSDFYGKYDIFTLPFLCSPGFLAEKRPLKQKKLLDDDIFLDEIVAKEEFATFEENWKFDRRAQDFLSFPFLKKIKRFLRIPLVHIVNFLLTFVSIAFLFVTGSCHSRGSAKVIVSTVIHLLSIVCSFCVAPRDVVFLITLAGCVPLLVAVILMLEPTGTGKDYYALRFISLVRIGQLQIFPFLKTRFLFRTFLKSGVNILFPVIVIGGLTYIAELLRTQIFMVRNQKFGTPRLNQSDPNYTLLSVPERLAGNPRKHASRPNGEDTRDLFAFYFKEDSYILYSIFNFWLAPALAISSFLSYQFSLSANLRDTQSLTISMITLLEDPATMADFGMKFWYCRWVGNVILLISFVFGCVFSPLTKVTSNDLNFFFGFEVAFCFIGLFEAGLSTAYAVHRCGRSWAAAELAEGDGRTKRLVVGDSLFLVSELVQLIYYSIAAPLCCAILLEKNICIISPAQYATFFITLRAVFFIRVLPRQYILSFLGSWIAALYAGIFIVVFFVGSASALADVAAKDTGKLPSPAVWRAAFESILRQTFTSAIPESLEGRWRPINYTFIAEQMSAKNLSVLQVDSSYSSYKLLFILSTIGKAVLASASGIATAHFLIPMSTLFLSSLPPKAKLLYKTLSGGIRSILKEGSARHDDFRPDLRRKFQRRKFNRIFESAGMPSWALRHLLEELNICRPNYQRRFMYVLEQLLVYLPISELRQQMVKEYMVLYDCFCGGGPAKLPFNKLPVFPPESIRCEQQSIRRSPLHGSAVSLHQTSPPSTSVSTV